MKDQRVGYYPKTEQQDGSHFPSQGDVVDFKTETLSTTRVMFIAVDPFGETKQRSNPPGKKSLVIGVTADDNLIVGFAEEIYPLPPEQIENAVYAAGDIKTFLSAEIKAIAASKREKAQRIVTIYQHSPRELARSGNIRDISALNHGKLNPMLFLDPTMAETLRQRLKADAIAFAWGFKDRSEPLPPVPIEARTNLADVVYPAEGVAVTINEYVDGAYYNASTTLERNAYEDYREVQNATSAEWLKTIASYMTQNISPKRNNHRPYNMIMPASAYFRADATRVYIETTNVVEGHDYMRTSVDYDDQEFSSGHVTVATFTTVRKDVRLVLFDKFSTGANVVKKGSPDYPIVVTLINKGFTPVGGDGVFLEIEGQFDNTRS